MENKKYQQALIQQAKLQNTFYNYTSLQPCAYFWKELVKGKQTPSLLIPDTLLINDKQSPLIWIYTNSKGKLQKSTNINFKDFVNKITNYCSPNQLAATLKRVTYNDHYINGNDVKLLNSRYLQNASFQQLGGQSEALITLQRYIKSNGNNPFICRTIWRKQKRSECYIITNKKSFYDENEPEAKRFIVKVSESSKGQPSPSRIVKAIQGKHLTETCKYLSSITDFMKLYRGINFLQMVGDFIKDQSGNWWLINIKAFQIENKFIRNPSSINGTSQLKNNLEAIDSQQKESFSQTYEKQKYQKTKICRYCQKSYLQSELNHYMTIRMLIQTDRYLLHLGKNYKWLRRSDIQNVDTHCLYQQHKICQRCYRLYMEIQQLMEVENQFLKNLGFQMEKKPKQLLMSLTNQEQLKTQSKNKELATLASCFGNCNSFSQLQSQQSQKRQADASNFPKIIQLGPNSNIIFQQNIPTKNDHIINKMIRYRMILYLKQLDQVQFPQFLKQQYNIYNFFLEYELFGVKNRIKLDFGTNFNLSKKLLVIKKLKINYFFSHSHQDVHQYLNMQDDDFSIKIYAELKNNKTKFDASGSKNFSMKKKTLQGFFSADPQKSFDKSINIGLKGQNSRQMTITKTDFVSKRILLGKLRLPIKQFFTNMVSNNTNKITKKDFYKFFSVNQVPHGWGLQGSIGIIPSQSYVNTSRMIFFTQDNLIYLPNDNYYYCQHLPEQWIDVVKKQLNQTAKNTNFQSMNMVNGNSEQGLHECISEQDSSQLLKYCNLNEQSPIRQIFKETHNLSHKKNGKKQVININSLQNDKMNIENSVNIKQKSLDSFQECSRDYEGVDSTKINKTKDSWRQQILREQINKYDLKNRNTKKQSIISNKKINNSRQNNNVKLY